MESLMLFSKSAHLLDYAALLYVFDGHTYRHSNQLDQSSE